MAIFLISPSVFLGSQSINFHTPAMRQVLLAIVAVSVLLTGCTNRQLMRSMVSQASTVMDIEYQMVLDNVALIECNPSALPWHVRINDGVVQVNDLAGLSGLGVQWGGSPNFTRGPIATRSVTEQWGADAVTNPRIVKKLQDVYREAIGLPPEPDPPFFLFQPKLRSTASATSHGHSKIDQWADLEDTPPKSAEDLPPGKIADKDDQQTGPSRSSVVNSTEEKVESPINWPDFEIPTGWFHVGHKCDVPANACYVGNHCDCYVWVMRDGVSDLSHFALVILAITNSQTKNLVNQQELAFTR